jgi:hypothetical protein
MGQRDDPADADADALIHATLERVTTARLGRVIALHRHDFEPRLGRLLCVHRARDTETGRNRCQQQSTRSTGGYGQTHDH